MSGRRLSKRQRERIRHLRERRRASAVSETLHSIGRSQVGRVVVRYGAQLGVEDAQGRIRYCLVRQNLGHPVCGDRVRWQPCDGERGIVTEILPRKTLLSRSDDRDHPKPLAANLTQLLVVIAPFPKPNTYLLDQYLVAGELLGLPVRILCNKSDRLTAADRAALWERFAHYTELRYPFLWVSVREGTGLSEFSRWLTRETSILLGQSGVGKSSLLKVLLPDQSISIGPLSETTGFGRHTTSAAICYRLPQGGFLIDSPGVRNFRPPPRSPSELARGFREIAPLIGGCRFANCHHEGEPGCALLQALRAGRLHPERLANFRRLIARTAPRRGRSSRVSR